MALCRLCSRAALAPARLIPLFPRAPDSGRLNRATGLTIELDDGLPQVMCEPCADLVDSTIYFQNQCALAEQKLLDAGFKKLHSAIKSDPESIPDIKSINYVDPDHNYEAEENFNVTSIPLLEGTVKVESDVTGKLKPAISKQRKNRKCKKVNLKDTSGQQEAGLRRGIIKVERKKNGARSKSKCVDRLKKCQEFSDGPLSENGPYRCKLCGSASATIGLFYAHLRIHVGYDHICEFCGKKFYAALSLKRHCMSWHGLQKELSCSQCEHKAISASRLREHERTHTGEKPFECDVCGGKFHSRSSIVQHLGLHFAVKSLPCDRCPSMFKNRRALTTHINQSHVRDYLYLCYLCDKKYSKNTTARKHLAKQHGVPRSQQGKIPRFSRSRAAIVN